MRYLHWSGLLFAACSAKIIPRETLVYGSQNDETFKLSPDGEMVAHVDIDDFGVKNMFVQRVSGHQTRQVTFERKNVNDFYWTGVNDIILFEQDNDGDENTMIFKKNISEHAPKDDRTIISNIRGVKAYMFDNNKRDPFVLIGLNDVMPSYHNIYKFDLLSNELTLVFTDQRFTAEKILADVDMNIRVAKVEQDDGSILYLRVSANATYYKFSSHDDHWEELVRVKPDDVMITRAIGFDETRENIYMIWGADSDLGSLVIAPLKNFTQRKVIYTATRAELKFLRHPKDRSILALFEDYHKPEPVFVNPDIAEDIQFLVNRRPNDSIFDISFSMDMNTWLVTYSSAEKPYDIFIYRRNPKSIKTLFSSNPQLMEYKLSRQIGFNFTAQDGLVIQAYLSIPPDVPLKSVADVSEEDCSLAEQGMIPVEPQNMILLVHGGPSSRDSFGYSHWSAFLTSRGYAVLRVNFRGSTGFGKRLYNAGNGEWSKKMHDDLLDAVNFTVAKGIAKRSEVAIMGASYGGYATLVGLTFTPDAFACGVDIVGPSNLVTLLESIPPYWEGIRQFLYRSTGGDIETENGRQALREKSPLFLADKVKKPLLIIQGANDARVNQKESEQFVSALKNHSIPVTYVLYPDEGHVIRRAPNRLAQYGLIEKFLHECLGGEYEPFTDGQYNESAIVESFGPATEVIPSSVSTSQEKNLELAPSDSIGVLPRRFPIMFTCFISFYLL